jgi:hypothetical protein
MYSILQLNITTPIQVSPAILSFLNPLILLGSQAAWSAVQQAAATLHERDEATLRDVRAGLRGMPGSRFFDS